MTDPQALAARLIAGLLTDADCTALAQDPFGALEALGFDLRMVPEPDITGDCSVAGSFDPGPPPVIKVVTADSVGRQHFSALHEFAHWVIAEDTAIHDVFFEQSDGGQQLEERVCDALAGQLLIPEERVAAHIGPSGPTARSVLDLIHASPNSSLEAACVRAAQRLSGPGHVMVARDGVALYTASHSTPFGVRRRTNQGPLHITAKAAERGTCREEAPVRYASGAMSDNFFADAALDPDGFVIAVFMENRPPWIVGLAIRSRAPVGADVYCTHCEVDFTAIGAPCSKCEDYFHYGDDGCGRCSCTSSTRDRVCDECFIRRPISNFTGEATTCHTCLGN